MFKPVEVKDTLLPACKPEALNSTLLPMVNFAELNSTLPPILNFEFVSITPPNLSSFACKWPPEKSKPDALNFVLPFWRNPFPIVHPAISPPVALISSKVALPALSTLHFVPVIAPVKLILPFLSALNFPLATPKPSEPKYTPGPSIVSALSPVPV